MMDCIEKIENNTNTRPYISPVIEVVIIELENSIAAGSALIDPRPKDEDIQQQWETSVTEERDLYW